MGIRMLPLAATLVAALMLAGCVPSAPVVTPVPESSVAPIFATDEDALAAATEAYRKYLDVADKIFAAGGVGVDLLSDVATGKQLAVERDGFTEVQSLGWHSVGATSFDQARLQRHDESDRPQSVVVIYLCEDISATKVLDQNGNSVASPDLPSRSLYEVTFDSNSTDTLLVSDRQLWDGNKC